MAKMAWTEMGLVDPGFKNTEFCQYSVNDIFGKVLAKIYRPKEVEEFVLKGKLHDLFTALQESPLRLQRRCEQLFAGSVVEPLI